MIKKAMVIRLKVKPLMGILVHSDFWEGPCRGGIREEMTPQAEMARAKKLFEQYQPLFQQLDPWVEVLEPVFVPYDESFVVEEKILQEIERDLPQTDCRPHHALGSAGIPDARRLQHHQGAGYP